MKKILTVITAAGLIGALSIGTAWAGRIGDRQVNQRKRIAQGVANGQLTGSEARLLIKEQRRIQAVKARMWSDGRLTAAERVRIERRQDIASRHIYRLKHNARGSI